jgi:hypothetical protein
MTDPIIAVTSDAGIAKIIVQNKSLASLRQSGMNHPTNLEIIIQPDKMKGKANPTDA